MSGDERDLAKIPIGQRLSAPLSEQVDYIAGLKYRITEGKPAEPRVERPLYDLDVEMLSIIYQTLLVFQIEGADKWVREKRARRGRR